MNDQVEGMPKPAPDMQKIVEDGARHFESVEAGLEKMHGKLLRLAPLWERGNAAGMLGALETGELTAETQAIAGLLAEARTRVYVMHRRGTKIAQDNNCDVPTTRGGGGR